MPKLYKDYFKIDKEFFPVMSERVFQENAEQWKKYYPHATFQQMLQTAVELLSRRKKLSMWVDGAYGTGKSYAVLTLKKLIDAGENEVREYFERYKLDNDLLNKFLAEKNNGVNLTVFLSGSASIYNDEDLLFALVEGIENALANKGLVNSRTGMRQAMVNWLSNKKNKNYFQSFIDDEYSADFPGKKVDDIISELQTFEGQPLNSLLDKIFKVAREQHFLALKMTVEDFCIWIKEIIEQNKLHSVFVVWDEFSEYFGNCANRVTGFQTIVELASSMPFYLMPVTHQTIFDNTPQGKKLSDRFVKCEIELPDNIAFDLLGHSMERDQETETDFIGIVDDLYITTRDSREAVKKYAKIGDETLKRILPIHPYAALLLKNIATAYKANARSMFTFIKDDNTKLSHGFQKYIENYGPYSDEHLLTADMLWEFFYDEGKNDLTPDVRKILDEYNRHSDENLTANERMVLRTILLLEAVSRNVGNSVELFFASDKNLDLTFEGTDFYGDVGGCVRSLLAKHIIFERNLGNKSFMYSAVSRPEGGEEVEGLKKKISSELKTSDLLLDDPMGKAFEINNPLELRYQICRVGDNNFDRKINDLRNQRNYGKMPVVVAFARNGVEAATIANKIQNAVQDKSYEMIFADVTGAQMTDQQVADYIENLAYSRYYASKDAQLSKRYETDAKNILWDWKDNIEKCEIVISSQYLDRDKHVVGVAGLIDFLKNLTHKFFPNALEQYTVIDGMWNALNIGLGAECGLKQAVSGTFRSGNESTKLENALKDAWKIEKYWEKSPSANISQIKIAIDKAIKEGFDREGRIAIRDVYEAVKQAPFGFKPCNLTAFVMGFVLKEYVNCGLSWSDGVTTAVLDISKMKEMVTEYLKQEIAPNMRYKDNYIVMMTDEEKAFDELSSRIFDIPIEVCSTVEAVRDRIRSKVREFAFPLWVLKYAQGNLDSTLAQVLDNYCILANNGNSQVKKSENDCAQEIGKVYRKNKGLLSGLKELVNKENFSAGMDNYLRQYKDGELVDLAHKINDAGQYLNVVKGKFTADAANWVWSQETANRLIDDAIVEYQIVFQSNKLLPFSNNLKDTVQQWNIRASALKISVEAMEVFSDYSNELKDFFKCLRGIQRNASFYGIRSSQFLELLIKVSDEFRNFESKQISVFKQLYRQEVQGLDNNDVQKIFNELPSMFNMDKSTANNMVREKVGDWNKNNKLRQLKQLWRDKTETDSPREWSKKNGMPILFMVNDNDFNRARYMFNVLNQIHPEDKYIDDALAYLRAFKEFFALKDARQIEEKFKEKVLGEYSVILDDLKEVREYLDKNLDGDVYSWALNSQLHSVIKSLAEKDYKQKAQTVTARIDSMPADRAKEYLKKLVRENVNVGVEILKNK